MASTKKPNGGSSRRPARTGPTRSPRPPGAASGAGTGAQAIVTGELPTLLRTIAAVLRETGVDEKTLQTAFAGATTHTRRSGADRHEALAASMIALWYTDPEYLDADGAPRALTERGTAPSVDALLRSIAAPRDRKAILELLRSSPSVTINTDGTWRLAGQNMMRVKGAAAARRMTRMTEALLRTELRNLGALGSGGRTLFSINAVVSDVPDEDATQLRGTADRLLRLPMEDLSAWLEKCHAKRGKRTMGEVGAVAFAYQLPRKTTGC